MKTLIIIQARMTSTRLPGKVMMPIGKKPVLQVMLERLSMLKDLIIIATTDDGTEKPIIELCKQLNVRYFQGDTNNVLERYYLAAKKYNATATDCIVRLTSDCPLVDGHLVQRVIEIFKCSQFDMVSLGTHSGFPRGLDTSVFNFSTLEQTYKKAIAAADKEHVTCGMSKFKDMTVHHISALEDYSQYRLTLDEPLDYQAICEVYRLMKYRTDFNFKELIELMQKHPEIYEINKNVIQKNI